MNEKTVTGIKTYGEITYNGKSYQLTSQATLSNAVFYDCFQNVEEGERYTAEYIATGIDNLGHEVTIKWNFVEHRGEEPEDEGSYPWDEQHIVSVKPY